MTVTYYAIHKGLKTGIFTTWGEVAPLVTGFKGAKYKKFTNRSAADKYVLLGDNACASLLAPIFSETDGSIVCYVTTDPVIDCTSFMSVKRSRDVEDNADAELPAQKYTKTTESHNNAKVEEYERLDKIDEVNIATEASTVFVRVFTDGSCLDLGLPTCRAGYGLWWNSDDDPKNISMKLIKPPYTNNRAELSAILLAIQIYDKEIDKKTITGSLQSLWIKTDSRYSINCITKWVKGWKRGGWYTTTGTIVENVDLLTVIDKLMLKYPHIKISYVPAHVGIEGNEKADNLAKIGADLPLH